MTIDLGAITLDPVTIGINGNAILGIKESGKSYMATLLAEQLFEAGIPFIAIDPIGIWHNLKVPGHGRGYPVVVAGGMAADMPLTPDSAPAIVEAAMRQGVSLVIDLFHMELSKADWRRIVKDCANLLLHRNAAHGLRHVFIEEAAEFVPQTVRDGQVYAAVEKLIRMGGNARLGCTLINPRAQEVNKAVLELCENLFLFRQRGKNALESLSKWLEVAGADRKAVIDALPNLPTGECFAWLSGGEEPVRVQVPAKNSFHPDRRALIADAAASPAAPVDVADFVEKLRQTLDAESVGPPSPTRSSRATSSEGSPERGRGAEMRPSRDAENRIAELEKENADLRAELEHLREVDAECERYSRAFAEIDAIVHRVTSSFSPSQANPGAEAPPSEPGGVEPVSRVEGATAPSVGTTADLPPRQQRILDQLAWACEAFHKPAVPRQVLAIVVKTHPRTKGFLNTLGELRTAGLIDYGEGGTVHLTAAGAKRATHPAIAGAPLKQLRDGICKWLPAAQARILRLAIDAFPNAIPRERLAELLNVHPRTKTFLNNTGRLKTLGLLTAPGRGTFRAAPYLLGKDR